MPEKDASGRAGTGTQPQLAGCLTELPEERALLLGLIGLAENQAASPVATSRAGTSRARQGAALCCYRC